MKTLSPAENIKYRFCTLVAILSLFVPTFLTLNLTDSGYFNLNTTSIAFIAAVCIFVLGLVLAACLNKEIDIVEAFLYVALFLLSVGLTLYVYITGFASKEENPKDFITNLSSVCFSFVGSIGQILAIFLNRAAKETQSEKKDAELGSSNVASSVNPNNQSNNTQECRSQGVSGT